MLNYIASKGGAGDEPDVTFSGLGASAVLQLNGARHLTFEGVDFQGRTELRCVDSGVPTEARGQQVVDVTFPGGGHNNLLIRNAQLVTFFGPMEIGPSSTAPILGGSGDTGGANCTDEAPSVTFDTVLFHDMIEGASTSHMECLLVEGVGSLTITNSVFHRCSVFDILLKPQLSGAAFGLRNVTICNNFFGHPVRSPFKAPGPSAISAYALTDSRICSNSSAGDILLRTDQPGTWSNTVVEGNLVNGVRASNCGVAGLTVRANAVLGNSRCPADLAQGANPGWVDPDTFADWDSLNPFPVIDYHLTAGAWPIDRMPLLPSMRDIDGDARPLGSAADVGADEFAAPLEPDTTPPVLTVPQDFTVQAPELGGAIVTYIVSATDDRDPNPVVSCSPASGSLFPVGESVVNCLAQDAAANSATASFRVTVTEPVPPPVTCPGESLPLSLVAEDAETITLGWEAVAGAVGYRFSRSDQAKRPHTWDGSRTTIRFSKGAACYRVEALSVLSDGGYP